MDDILEIIEDNYLKQLNIKRSKIPDLVIIADFEKGFDKIGLEFIYKCLDYFHFSESLIQWVNVMYSKPGAKQ
jgi:hypothetical protein